MRLFSCWMLHCLPQLMMTKCCLVLSRKCTVGLSLKRVLGCCSVFQIFCFRPVCLYCELWTVTTVQSCVNFIRLGRGQLHNRMSIEPKNFTMATQQSETLGFCLLCQKYNNVQGLPSPPNQTLLLFIPEGTKEANPKYLSQILHYCWERPLRNEWNKTQAGHQLW